MKTVVELPVENITSFTLLDYPDNTACILWFAGCNMSCPYCYNPEIVHGKGKISVDEVLNFLKKRINLLDGVVFSGGECTKSKSFLELARKVKELGFKIKVDTNGSMPQIIEVLLKERLVDFFALDFKAPSEKYQLVSGSKLFKRFEQSFQMIQANKIPFEVRTTFHSGLLDKSDLKSMRDWLDLNNYKGNLHIQQFVGDKPTLGKIEKEHVDLQQKDTFIQSMNVNLRSRF